MHDTNVAMKYEGSSIGWHVNALWKCEVGVKMGV